MACARRRTQDGFREGLGRPTSFVGEPSADAAHAAAPEALATLRQRAGRARWTRRAGRAGVRAAGHTKRGAALPVPVAAGWRAVLTLPLKNILYALDL